MTRQPRARFSWRLLLRHHVHLLAGLSFLFVLQSGVVPFDFSFDRPVVRAVETATNPLSLPDIVANLFLYVPLGMFLHGSLSRATGRPSLAYVVTVLLCGLLSGGIEWVQAYSPSRVSSLIDLTANTTGAALGASMSSVGRWILPRLIGAALFEFRARPTSAVLKAYCGLLVVTAAIPFSFSFDAQRLGKSVKASVFIPFGSSMAQRESAELAAATTDTRTISLLRWERMRRWARWAAEAASFAVLAWLMQLVLRGDYGFARRGAFWLTWWLWGMFAIALSGLQLPIVSRGCDVTDIIFRWLGIALGLAAVAMAGRGAVRGFALSRRARVGTVGVAAYIVYTGLLPFEFAAPRHGVWSPLSTAAFLPFMAYFETRFDVMMTDALEKFAAYVLLAAALSAAWSKAASASLGGRLLCVTGVGVVLSSAVEMAQMFLPVRVVSLTDPIVAAAGCLVGVVLADHAVRFYRYATSAEIVGPDDRPVGQRRPLSLTDELIATLAEPHPQSPSEPSPTKQPVGDIG